MRNPVELTDSFREHGLRITPQRVAVFEAMHQSVGHPSAESIYHTVVTDMPSISLRTVYQTLNDLADMGEIRRLDFGAKAALFDSNLDDHHHLLCSQCGLIIDAYLDLSGLRLSGLDGFQATGVSVFVSGLCEGCAAATTTTTTDEIRPDFAESKEQK